MFSTHLETFLDYYGDQPDQVLRFKMYINRDVPDNERIKSTILYVLLFPAIQIYRLFRLIFIRR